MLAVSARDVRHLLPETSIQTVRMQIAAGDVLCQTIGFSRITPTTKFTLISLSKVLSHSFLYTMPVKEWVKGHGFFAWELDSDPVPSSAC